MLTKTSLILASSLLATSCFCTANAADQEMTPEAIADRIKPVGSVYSATDLAGIAPAAAPVATASATPRDGETVFKSACFACHDTGAAGAPKRGDKAAWEPRIAQGIATLKQHAIAGFQGKSGVMPPRGTCATCSDEEIENAIHFMIDKL